MKVAILSVGTEILFGQITNTNTVYLSQQLNLLGFDVLYHYAVGDNEGRLADIFQEALHHVDLVITTGGLGPTEDDLTKETAAAVFHDHLVEHGESLAALEAMAERHGWHMTPNNYKQVMMPSRAVVFANRKGTAPGFALAEGGKQIICMPGPPREMRAVFEDGVLPYLQQYADGVIRHRVLRFFGIGEPTLETRLLPLIQGQTDPTVATYAKEGQVSVRVASKRATAEEADQAIQDMIQQIVQIAGDFLYSLDDEALHQVLGRRLIEKGISFSVCESCTGGLFAARLVEVPGISQVFQRGLVTYTAQAKVEELGVSEETIRAHTVVSRQVASEMVRGLQQKTGSRLCLSVTGVAGPGPDGAHPAGRMFIGVRLDDRERIIALETAMDERAWNRNYACLVMADAALKMLEKEEGR